MHDLEADATRSVFDRAAAPALLLSSPVAPPRPAAAISPPPLSMAAFPADHPSVPVGYSLHHRNYPHHHKVSQGILGVVG